MAADNDNNISKLENKSDIEKQKQDVVNCLYAVVEMLDDQIPIVGKVLDLPIVNGIEHKVVEAFVDAVWDAQFVDEEDILPWSM